MLARLVAQERSSSLRFQWPFHKVGVGIFVNMEHTAQSLTQLCIKASEYKIDKLGEIQSIASRKVRLPSEELRTCARAK